MTKTVVICGDLFDGLSDALLGPTEILIEDDTIAEVSGSVGSSGRREDHRSERPHRFSRFHRHSCSSLRRRLESRAANASVLAGQGACGTSLRPAIHALRLHDASRHGHAGSGMAHHQSARRHRQRPGSRTASDRCCPYDQRDRGSRRHARHVPVPMPYGTFQGCGLRRRKFASWFAWSTRSAAIGSRP